MSLGSSVGGAAFALESGFDLSTTNFTLITNGASNTKGAYVELLSAANNVISSNRVIVCVGDKGNAQLNTFLIDLAIGSAGNEVNLIENMMCRTSSTSTAHWFLQFDFPISIPKNVRISARCQAPGSSRVIGAYIIRLSDYINQDIGLSLSDTYGAVTSSATAGTTVAANTTINTFGSWVEMTASTVNDLSGFLVSAMRIAATYMNQVITYEVGVGSAGNEETIFSGQSVFQNTNETGKGFVSPFVGVEIPAGSRIAIRAQTDLSNTAGDLDYIIIGAR